MARRSRRYRRMLGADPRQYNPVFLHRKAHRYQKWQETNPGGLRAAHGVTQLRKSMDSMESCWSRLSNLVDGTAATSHAGTTKSRALRENAFLSFARSCLVKR